ncbi:FAD-dependent sensor of blue light [Comamonas sp. BIGb0124]|uniref:BLUF domain-containing protein n=1 Tax=Comamonas sp. BIGb0124 TaxID=2485130 RepID=UPI000FAC5EC6|nr:BLUF domain-containing protein [Comamonas sp. BIGb0124]ROR24813.1 FAD-dependent sensor of blue light [Comamonas sp. BIGb0124]
MSSLHRLFYISRADEQLGHRGLAEILPGARRYNEAHGITGILNYDGAHYAQILEGPADELLKLMVRIYADPRHQETNLLFFEPLAQRQYRAWALGYVYEPQLIEDVARCISQKVVGHAEAKALASALLAVSDQMA